MHPTLKTLEQIMIVVISIVISYSLSYSEIQVLCWTNKRLLNDRQYTAFINV